MDFGARNIFHRVDVFRLGKAWSSEKAFEKSPHFDLKCPISGSKNDHSIVVAVPDFRPRDRARHAARESPSL
jgi:hypothetical protein